MCRIESGRKAEVSSLPSSHRAHDSGHSGLLWVRGFEHNVHPVSVQSVLEAIECLSSWHNWWGQRVPIDDSCAERISVGERSRPKFVQFPSAAPRQLGLVSLPKILVRYVHPTVKQFVYCYHVSTTTAVVRWWQIQETQSLLIWTVSDAHHHPRRWSLNALELPLVCLTEWSPDSISELQKWSDHCLIERRQQCSLFRQCSQTSGAPPQATEKPWTWRLQLLFACGILAVGRWRPRGSAPPPPPRLVHHSACMHALDCWSWCASPCIWNRSVVRRVPIKNKGGFFERPLVKYGEVMRKQSVQNLSSKYI